MDTATRDDLGRTLQEIRDAGLWKYERELTSAQAAHVTTGHGAALNFCANNYLGLADHPQVVAAASAALEEWGFGLASVRFICGTQILHTELERRLADFLGLPAAILYSSCFDANGGIFETLFGPEDAIVSDELNHASLIDGIRLSRARRLRYRNADMADLAAQLEAAAGARRIVVVTDGVFSMDGSYAPLDQICDLAEAHGAMVLVDDSHAVGFVGRVAAAHRSSSGSRTASTSSPARWARRSVAHPAGTSRPTSRWSTCCASGRARTSSRTRSPRSSWPARWPPSTSPSARPTCGSPCSTTPPRSGPS